MWKFAKIYNNSKTLAKINANFEVIKFWWHSFGEALSTNLEKLNHWLSFWHFELNNGAIFLVR
jgi:hypothetical protein